MFWLILILVLCTPTVIIVSHTTIEVNNNWPPWEQNE